MKKQKKQVVKVELDSTTIECNMVARIMIEKREADKKAGKNRDVKNLSKRVID